MYHIVVPLDETRHSHTHGRGCVQPNPVITAYDTYQFIGPTPVPLVQRTNLGAITLPLNYQVSYTRPQYAYVMVNAVMPCFRVHNAIPYMDYQLKWPLVPTPPSWRLDVQINFTITPGPTINRQWTNIMHFTGTGSDCCGDGSRIPGIWFRPNTRNLYIIDGHSALPNSGNDDLCGQTPAINGVSGILFLLGWCCM